MAVITGRTTLTIRMRQVGAVGTKSSGIISESESWKIDLANGTLLDQCDLMHPKTYTLAASTPQTLNLFDGSLLGLAGEACPFRRLDLWAWRVRSTTDAHVVLIGGAGTNEWNGWLTVTGSKATAFPSTASNQGWTVVTAPNTTGAVVSNTSKLLKIDPGSNAVGAFDVVLIGRSA